MCVHVGDFSPLCPLTWQDAIYIQVFESEKRKMDEEKIRLIEDIHFFAERLSLFFTGDKGMNYLPSKIAEMSQNYERFYGGKSKKG